MGGEVPLEAAFSAAAAARSPQKKRSPWTTEALQRRREQASPWAPRVDVVIHSVLHDLQETAVCQHRQKRLTQRLDRILKDVYGEQAVLKVFGSTVCSLACKNSDLDMTFTPGRSKSLSISEKKTALRKVAKELQSHGMRAVPVLGARVPIVKIRDQSDTWLAVDLSVENDLPVFKSRLLHEYTLIDARFAKLVQLVKAWAKTRQINSAAQGTFNSFGLSLLVLHYLQNVEPPVLPRLNEATLELRGDARLRAAVGVSDTRLFAKPARVLGTCDGITICHHTHQHLVGWGSENIASLAALTRGFFEYYSRHFSWDRQVVSVTLPGMVLKSSVAFHEGQQTNVCIQDPLDQSDNCARSVGPDAFARILCEFERASGLDCDALLLDARAAAVRPTNAQREGIKQEQRRRKREAKLNRIQARSPIHGAQGDAEGTDADVDGGNNQHSDRSAHVTPSKPHSGDVLLSPHKCHGHLSQVTVPTSLSLPGAEGLMCGGVQTTLKNSSSRAAFQNLNRSVERTTVCETTQMQCLNLTKQLSKGSRGREVYSGCWSEAELLKQRRREQRFQAITGGGE